MLPGDPREEDGKLNALVTKIRLRKGLKQPIPALENFIDKLWSHQILFRKPFCYQIFVLNTFPSRININVYSITIDNDFNKIY